MRFYVDMIKGGKRLKICYQEGECTWWYDGRQVKLPVLNCQSRSIRLVVSSHCIFVEGENEGKPFQPYDLEVYDFHGNYLWNVGDIARTISPRQDRFFYVEVHTKTTLLEDWFEAFGSCSLDDNHEYLTAYDGGERWLFDITDRKFIKRVFTH